MMMFKKVSCSSTPSAFPLPSYVWFVTSDTALLVWNSASRFIVFSNWNSDYKYLLYTHWNNVFTKFLFKKLKFCHVVVGCTSNSSACFRDSSKMMTSCRRHGATENSISNQSKPKRKFSKALIEKFIRFS